MGSFHKIALDLTGSDRLSQELLPVIQSIRGTLNKKENVLFYLPKESKEAFETLLMPGDSEFFEVEYVEEVISMEDSPLHVVRRKRNSPIVLGMKALAEKKISAFVTAGNTGACVAAANMYLPKFSSINRPALLVYLPTRGTSVTLLDVGANINVTSEQLIQFAKMGITFQNCFFEKKEIRVALLNIGVEEGKGTEALQGTYTYLEQLNNEDNKIVFIGNLEPSEIFHGHADVVVSDGFTGNIFLKTSEGTSSFILECLHDIFDEIPDAQEVFLNLKKALRHTASPGALVIGVEGIVIKCHGNASSESLFNSYKRARDLVRTDFISDFKNQLKLMG